MIPDISTKILDTFTPAAHVVTTQFRACFRRRPLGLSLLEKPHPHAPFEVPPTLSASLELPPRGFDSAADVDVDANISVSDGLDSSKS